MYEDTSELTIATMVTVVTGWLVQPYERMYLYSSLVDIIFFLCQFVSLPYFGWLFFSWICNRVVYLAVSNHMPNTDARRSSMRYLTA